jgi:hypothetical protein
MSSIGDMTTEPEVGVITRKGSPAKDCRWPLDARKVKETHPALELPEANGLSCSNGNPVKLISDFWPEELEDKSVILSH